MNYDNWLQQPYQDDERESDRFDALVDSLMEEECNPHDTNNFIVAITEGECLLNVLEELQQAIQIGETGYEKIGKVIWQSVYDYWADQANERAADKL